MNILTIPMKKVHRNIIIGFIYLVKVSKLLNVNRYRHNMENINMIQLNLPYCGVYMCIRTFYSMGGHQMLLTSFGFFNDINNLGWIINHSL